MPTTTTTPRPCLALQVFTHRVQQHAHIAIDNQHAGCTDDERHFIRKYFQAHRKQSLTTAIIQCTMLMLEQYRPSELQ